MITRCENNSLRDTTTFRSRMCVRLNILTRTTNVPTTRILTIAGNAESCSFANAIRLDRATRWRSISFNGLVEVLPRIRYTEGQWICAIAKDSGGDAQENHDSLICHPDAGARAKRFRSVGIRRRRLVFSLRLLEEDELSEFVGISVDAEDRCRTAREGGYSQDNRINYRFRRFVLRDL